MRNPALRKYIDRVWPIRGIENSLQKGVENSEKNLDMLYNYCLFGIEGKTVILAS
jgi:hypothetical protein